MPLPKIGTFELRLKDASDSKTSKMMIGFLDYLVLLIFVVVDHKTFETSIRLELPNPNQKKRTHPLCTMIWAVEDPGEKRIENLWRVRMKA